MAYKQIKLELSGNWVLEHRTADKLPIKAFIDFCTEAFGAEMQVEQSSFTGCTVLVKNAELSNDDIEKRIIAILRDRLKIQAMADVAKVSITEVEPDNSDSKPEETKPEETNPEVKAKPDGKNVAVDDVAKTLSDSQAPAADPQPEISLDEKIDSLVGADEYKALVGEIKSIASHIKSRKTFDVFAYQNYLFSINDGYGLTTYLELFADLIEANGLFEFNGKQKVYEMKPAPPGNSQPDPFSAITSIMHGYKKTAGALIAIDISEWMTKLTTKKFRDFLAYLERHSAENLFVFRIPFVESDVLDDIHSALQDVIFVRPVSFPPMNMNELTECAKRFIAKQGFTAEDDVWDVFGARIVEEKSDGRFYGLNTVNKIIREMIYRKQLSDIRNNRDDTIIKKEEILSLAKTETGVVENGMRTLESMVGMEPLKAQLEEILAHIELSLKNKSVGSPCIHMRFVGSPGTGKTTVARIVGQILKERGVLRNGYFFEYSGRDFCGVYIGETAPKTSAMCRDAYGSVLFIDEAYSLYRGSDNTKDFGREALETLIAEMENHRKDLVVIMAGYTDEMELLMEGNKGLESRMPYRIEFKNYTQEQLTQIFFKMVGDDFEYDEEFRQAVSDYFNAISDTVIESKNFSNARFVRNLFERTCAKASMRNLLEKSDKITLTTADFKLASSERAFETMISKKAKNKIGF